MSATSQDGIIRHTGRTQAIDSQERAVGQGSDFGRTTSGRGSMVASTTGVASRAPSAFMELFDKLIHEGSQARRNVRRGANMGVLPVDAPGHP